MPSLIPVVINVTADDSTLNPISNDPLAAFDKALFPFDTDFRSVAATVVPAPTVYAGQSGGLSISTSTPKFGAGCLGYASASTFDKAALLYPITPGAALDILPTAMGDFTIDCWVRMDNDIGAGFTVWDYGDTQVGADGNNYGIVLRVSNISIAVETGITRTTGGTWGQLAGGGLTPHVWTHIAVVRSAGTATLYLNGVSQGFQLDWSHYIPPTAGTSLLALGTNAYVNGGSGSGSMDEFRITNSARWTANFTPPTSATTLLPRGRGYSADSTNGGGVYGSTSPTPPLIDTDTMVIAAGRNAGTFSVPIYTLQLEINSSVNGGPMFQDDLTAVSFTDDAGVPRNYLSTAATFTQTTLGGIWVWPTSSYSFARFATVPFTLLFEDPNVDFNCDCEVVSPYATLASVRTKMLIRMGYPNQIANPPPGMAILIDQFLRDAQDEIYRQLQRAALRTERFYRWTMVPGQRYYNLAANEGDCAAVLDPYKVTWCGFEDLNRAWYRLDEGIPPEYYTRANINFGWPTRFEIRSCIEIFPAPQAAYTLWIKGDFGVDPLAADSDRFTIDDKMVYLLALGNMKAHYGHADAQLVLTQAGNMTKGIVAGTHGKKRYVPQAGTANPLTPPRFLPLGNNQA